MIENLPVAASVEVFGATADCVAINARELAAMGWTPATSSNFSMRVGADHAAITISGRDKRAIDRAGIMLVDMKGHAVGSTARPSAETALHTHIYRRWPDITAVLHTHSRTQSVASRLFAREGVIRLRGWELQKAIAGCTTHESTLEIPVFPNTQQMPELVANAEAWLDTGKPLRAYLIDGHGMYTWGRDMTEARRHLEALEFILGCELDLRRLAP
ncbi:MAG: methylthioribulose 1-phosphate dehydratase [Rhodanobacter sp.]|nr:MAG: methylthioribulose 1-phosphate dehydratase [Rhodanobacter sp.]